MTNPEANRYEFWCNKEVIEWCSKNISTEELSHCDTNASYLKRNFLRQAFEDVTPAYHMNKVHWNSVTLGGDVPEEDLKRMVGNSYDLIKPKVRKRKWK